MGRDIRIIPLDLNRTDVLRFLKVSYKIYENDPNWVAPLLMDAVKVLLPENPLFKHARIQLWMAFEDGHPAGRIAGIIDSLHQKIHQDGAAFFGFFECVDDKEVSDKLFDTVTTWARRNGAKVLRGPMNPTTNDECGFLVDGFDSPPVFMMTYNPRYYIKLVESAGFQKARDLLAYAVDVSKCPLDRLEAIAEKVRKRNPDIRLSPVRRATLNSDLEKVKQVYNAAWEKNWGFVPMTDAEINFMADRLKPLFVEGLVWLAFAQDDPVGFLLALPDYNEAFKPLKGKLLSPQIIKFLPYLFKWKIPQWCRVLTLGVVEKYRNRGLEAAMLWEGFKVGIGMGIKFAECSWVLEDNILMNRLMEFFGGSVYKRYRIYEKSL